MSGEIFSNRQLERKVFISRHFVDELTEICVDALPHKAFGLIGGDDPYHPKSLYPCSTNLRNTPEWKPLFESFGDFYRNPDLGFVISAPEVKVVMELMISRRESLVGVFHSHRFLPAEPSVADMALNSDPGLLCYIVSLVNPSKPEMGVFRLGDGKSHRVPISHC
jgi:proteasome lid subunit RPN8/RPN11